MSGQILDGYGDAVPVDDFLADMDGWLRARAARLCDTSRAKGRLDDVVQEGRIELWRIYRETGSTDYAMARATLRMKAIAWHSSTQHVGGLPRERYTGAQDDISVDLLIESGVWDMFAGVDGMTDVEVAYHHGEIMAAVNALTPKQRQYVYARFWCGIDMPAGSRNDGVKAAKEANPIMRRDNLWTGGNKDRKGVPMPGAKQRLAASLAHLRDLVATA